MIKISEKTKRKLIDYLKTIKSPFIVLDVDNMSGTEIKGIRVWKQKNKPSTYIGIDEIMAGKY